MSSESSSQRVFRSYALWTVDDPDGNVKCLKQWLSFNILRLYFFVIIFMTCDGTASFIEIIGFHVVAIVFLASFYYFWDFFDSLSILLYFLLFVGEFVLINYFILFK